MFYSQYESCSKSLAFVHVGPLRTGYVQTRDIGSLPFQDMNKQPFLARCFSTMEISLRRNLLQLHSNREYLIQVYYWRFYVPCNWGQIKIRVTRKPGYFILVRLGSNKVHSSFIPANSQMFQPNVQSRWSKLDCLNVSQTCLEKPLIL